MPISLFFSGPARSRTGTSSTSLLPTDWLWRFPAQCLHAPYFRAIGILRWFEASPRVHKPKIFWLHLHSRLIGCAPICFNVPGALKAGMPPTSHCCATSIRRFQRCLRTAYFFSSGTRDRTGDTRSYEPRELPTALSRSKLYAFDIALPALNPIDRSEGNYFIACQDNYVGDMACSVKDLASLFNP